MPIHTDVPTATDGTSPVVDYALALFSGSLITTSNVKLEFTNEPEFKPLIWIAAVEDPCKMQDLCLNNQYVILTLIMYQRSIEYINKLGLNERGVRSLIRRLGISEKLKQEAREAIKL